MNNKINRMKELVQELNQHSYNYYVLDNPTISDKEYDRKYDELLALEQETNHIEENSPTQRIGDAILEGFRKVSHKNKLWSLDKSQSKEELRKFYDDVVKFCKVNKLPNPKFIVTKKYDGLSIKSEYDEQGILKQSSSRGTGEIGEDLTTQSKTIVNLPHKINYNHPIHVHGEALMTKRSFNDYNKNAEIPLKNLRNGASGALRQLNIKECAKRKLSVFFYNVNYIEGKEFKTYSEQLEFIKECGLPTTEYKIYETFEEICNEIDNIKNQRPNLEYDIDGVVIAVDDIKTREMLGYTIKFPKYANAFKFEAEETTTTLLGVEWNVGRTGRVNPKAIVEPVELAGVEVKRATLNNIDDIKKKGVKIGSTVFIRRSNDVIPEIMGVTDETEGEEIIPPTNCPSCGTKLVMDGAYLKCTNSLNCKPQSVKSIVHYCQREAMNIVGFSEQSAELFFEKGIIHSVLDLYNLEFKKNEIINLPKFGLKKYNNLIDSINKSKQCDLSAFIYGLGIDNCGKKTSKDLVKFASNEYMKSQYDVLSYIMTLDYEKLLKMPDCGEITAKSISDYFHNQDNLNMIGELLKHIEFNEIKLSNEETKQDILSGKTLYCTGTFECGKKNDLIKMVEDNGGTFAGGYAKSLSYLVIGKLKGSSKEAKAIKDGVTVLQEDEFLKMIGR